MNIGRAVGVLCFIGLNGCFLINGRAEMVKREKTGGVLALKGDREKAMADAEQQMSSNCPRGYEIVGEEMAKVGEQTESAEDTAFRKKSASKSTSTITQDVKEYRITYACNGG